MSRLFGNEQIVYPKKIQTQIGIKGVVLRVFYYNFLGRLPERFEWPLVEHRGLHQDWEPKK